MNCMFNEHNPSDHPAIMKITSCGKEPCYIITDLHYTDDMTRIDVLRNMEKYLTKRICFDRGCIIEAINVLPRDVRKYLNRGIVPEGMYVSKETAYTKQYYEAIGRKVTSVQRMEL